MKRCSANADCEGDYMNIGDRVFIISCHKYHDRFINQCGTIMRIYDKHYGIKIDNEENRNSQYGLFWFEHNQIQTKRKEYFMVKYNKIAVISFMDGNSKSFKYALYDDNVQVDDLVVVMTGHHGMSTAKVNAVIDADDTPITDNRQVICRIDMTAYQARIEKAKQMKKIKEKMDAKVKHLQDMAIYEMLSESDDELKTLLSEYKGLIQ